MSGKPGGMLVESTDSKKKKSESSKQKEDQSQSKRSPAKGGKKEGEAGSMAEDSQEMSFSEGDRSRDARRKRQFGFDAEFLKRLERPGKTGKKRGNFFEEPDSPSLSAGGISQAASQAGSFYDASQVLKGNSLISAYQTLLAKDLIEPHYLWTGLLDTYQKDPTPQNLAALERIANDVKGISWKKGVAEVTKKELEGVLQKAIADKMGEMNYTTYVIDEAARAESVNQYLKIREGQEFKKAVLDFTRRNSWAGLEAVTEQLIPGYKPSGIDTFGGYLAGVIGTGISTDSLKRRMGELARYLRDAKVMPATFVKESKLYSRLSPFSLRPGEPRQGYTQFEGPSGWGAFPVDSKVPVGQAVQELVSLNRGIATQAPLLKTTTQFGDLVEKASDLIDNELFRAKEAGLNYKQDLVMSAINSLKTQLAASKVPVPLDLTVSKEYVEQHYPKAADMNGQGGYFLTLHEKLGVASEFFAPILARCKVIAPKAWYAAPPMTGGFGLWYILDEDVNLTSGAVTVFDSQKQWPGSQAANNYLASVAKGIHAIRWGKTRKKIFDFNLAAYYGYVDNYFGVQNNFIAPSAVSCTIAAGDKTTKMKGLLRRNTTCQTVVEARLGTPISQAKISFALARASDQIPGFYDSLLNRARLLKDWGAYVQGEKVFFAPFINRGAARIFAGTGSSLLDLEETTAIRTATPMFQPDVGAGGILGSTAAILRKAVKGNTFGGLAFPNNGESNFYEKLASNKEVKWLLHTVSLTKGTDEDHPRFFVSVSTPRAGALAKEILDIRPDNTFFDQLYSYFETQKKFILDKMLLMPKFLSEKATDAVKKTLDEGIENLVNWPETYASVQEFFTGVGTFAYGVKSMLQFAKPYMDADYLKKYETSFASRPVKVTLATDSLSSSFASTSADIAKRINRYVDTVVSEMPRGTWAIFIPSDFFVDGVTEIQLKFSFQGFSDRLLWHRYVALMSVTRSLNYGIKLEREKISQSRVQQFVQQDTKNLKKLVRTFGGEPNERIIK